MAGPSKPLPAPSAGSGPSRPLGGEGTRVEVAADSGEGKVFVRSPETGDERAVSGEEARRLVFSHGWEPVVPEEAPRLITRQLLRERSSPWTAAGYGAARGLSGGLVEYGLPQGDEAGAEALRALREEHSGTALAGEVGGTLLPFLPVLRGVKLLSLPGLADAAGGAVARTVGAGSPGFLRTAAARTVGMALEGGVAGTAYQAGESAIEDSPLTAQKLAAGFMYGATPGAILGAGVGAFEGAARSLGSRYALRGGLAREHVMRPGLDDADMMRIAEREHGVAVPGLLDEFHANQHKGTAVTADIVNLAGDSGKVGQQIRDEFLRAPELRRAAETEAAGALNQIRDLDDLAISGVAGRMKADQVRKWIPHEADSVDLDAVVRDAMRADEVAEAAPQRRAGDALGATGKAPDDTGAPRAARIDRLATELERWVKARHDPLVVGDLLSELGISDVSKLGPALRMGLAGQNEFTTTALARAFRKMSPEGRAGFVRGLGKAADVPGGAPWKDAALRAVDDIGAEFDALAAAPRGVVGRKPSAANEIRDLAAAARGAIDGGGKSDAFVELDYLKKRLARYARPGEYLGPDDSIAASARRAYADIREALESPVLWGEKAALAQRDINRVFTNRINRAEAFWNNFFVDSGKAHPANPWVKLREATPDSVSSQMKGIIDPKSSREYAAFQQHIAEGRDVVKNLREHYHLSPEEAGKLAQWERSIKAAEDSMSQVAYYSRREAQAAALFGGSKNPVPGWAKWVAGHFLGPVGFFGMIGAEAALNPGAGLHMRAVLERTLRNSEGRIASSVTKLLTGKGVKFEGGVGAAQSAAKASVSLFREKDPKKRKESYAETLKELTQLSTPENAAKQAAAVMPFAVGVLPRAPEYLGMNMAKAAQHLLQNAPTGTRWTPFGLETVSPSDVELDAFERRYRAAFDPISIFEDAADGKYVGGEAVEAAEAVAPELVDHVRLLMLDEMSNWGDKKRPPYERLVGISVALGITLDPTLEPEYINAQQMMHAARFKEQPDNRRTYEETGVNESLRASKVDKIEADIPPA